MRHLKLLLLGIILLSSFSSAFADDGYDFSQAKQDVFDQIISVLVPLIIVFLFKESEEDFKKKKKDLEKRIECLEKRMKALEEKFPEIREDTETNDQGENVNILVQVFNKLKSNKIRRTFDDFLFLLSLFVLPTIVFHKHHETPLWISIVSGVIACVTFIMIIINYIGYYIRGKIELNYWSYIYITIMMSLCHIFSDICFLFYTQSISVGENKDIFIGVHAVSGILGSIGFLGAILGILTEIYSDKSPFVEKLHSAAVGDDIGHLFNNVCNYIFITIFSIWTPIIQMLNMALLSGNDYYLTKLILALNLIYLSRVLYYAVKEFDKSENSEKNETFGLLNIIFLIRSKFRSKEIPF
ncbi:hypothetical protein RclHR1_09190002 [Rhizophagus clarus]|uniref:TLC domain-containing protein n=1 Tax=Rhizophagus clarus TaxID=94130 RepID=A0A2Z6S3P1_9GLOM|nr:hypothetical protein RclHR1_09190002 [Rhizophagus clarus]GES78675.1 hypothetical protein GLOIN_2v1815713 [Rhizophagus clarus]